MYDKYPHTVTAKKYCCEQKYGMSAYFGKTKFKFLYIKIRVLQNKKNVVKKIVANITFRRKYVLHNILRTIFKIARNSQILVILAIVVIPFNIPYKLHLLITIRSMYI